MAKGRQTMPRVPLPPAGGRERSGSPLQNDVTDSVRTMERTIEQQNAMILMLLLAQPTRRFRVTTELQEQAGLYQLATTSMPGEFILEAVALPVYPERPVSSARFSHE